MKVGVVGAGVMGTGLAESLAEAGHDVLLVDTSQDTLDRVRESIEKSLKMRRLFGGKKELPKIEDLMLKIFTSTTTAILEQAEFVIENVTEDIALKEEIYADLDAVVGPKACFAVNTSAVLVERLASRTNRPDKVLGIHFMNPVPLKDTVEVIRAPATSDETMETAMRLLESMGKNGIVVNDAPGFVSNRILMLTVNEAVAVVDEGTADAQTVDRIFKECFGHKMGPLETADLIGLDTILDTLEVLHAQLGDEKFVPHSLLKAKVDAGDLGRKTGTGFHRYGGRG
ncbi:MAG TPA: 3-hydroxyacyl-CoA dehydrogenase family protein [Actinomycetota bacterium]|nr:3-hydroxyacyl-CoA dehydrogenase family protein [Actinomycetota bacterium]